MITVHSLMLGQSAEVAIFQSLLPQLCHQGSVSMRASRQYYIDKVAAEARLANIRMC
ncbi:hypothetical protein LAD64_27850 [Klebsiella pneumoniae]|nr:hypothetical protein [Klebsiella pneumoniae]